MAHPFRIGSTYANRNGSYEVVSLDEGRNHMVIRYVDTGNTLSTPIDGQARIWENMDLEQQEAVQRVAAEEARSQKGYGQAFSGLSQGDFKTSIESTTWRSRQGLAGRVSKLLSDGTDYTFVSSAIYPWPIAFLTHHAGYQIAAFDLGSRKAKFTIELDAHNAYYGFYIERNNGPMDDTWDWPRLIRTLRSNESLRDVIEYAEAEHAARFIGRMSKGEEHFHFSNGIAMGSKPLWNEANAAEQGGVLKRLEQLDTIPEDHWGEIYIIGTMPKRDAIEYGVKVAEPMVRLMRALLPIYKAAV